MLKIILAVSCILFAVISKAQSTFTSVKQSFYVVGGEKGFTKVKDAYNHMEIAFYVKRGYIFLTNKDINDQVTFINVTTGPEPETWRAFNTRTKVSYLFRIIFKGNNIMVSLEDGTNLHVYFVKHSKKNSD